MMDLEDGELPSSENDDISRDSLPSNQRNNEFMGLLDDSEYVILDRPKSKFTRSSAVSKPSSTTTSSSSSLPPIGFDTAGARPSSSHDSTDAYQQNLLKAGALSASNPGVNACDYEMFGKKGYYHGLGVSDLLESSGAESSADSDDDLPFGGKKSRMNMAYPNDNSMSMPSGGGPFGFTNTVDLRGGTGTSFSAMETPSNCPDQALSTFNAAAAHFQQHVQQRKPNLVWANLMQEEQISNIFEGVRVEEPTIADVEVRRGPETYTFQRPMRQPRERRESDSSDISSGGLSDNALHYLRDGCSFDDEETGESSEHSLPLSFKSGNAVARSANSRKVSKRKRNNQKYKKKLISKLKKMKAIKLAEYMASKLVEEKVNLLLRSVEILGKDVCIRVFLKTLKIERRGGVMVKNQKRRRTAGGVYLYLIRGDPRVPKSQIDLIFRDERYVADKIKRKKQVAKRLRNKAKLESELEAMNNELDSDDTEVPEREQDGTDTGHFGDDSTQESSVHEGNTPADMNCDGSES